MDHTEAVDQYAVEKYLLEELSPEARAAFEEHYFGCEECATDLRAAAVFIAQARKELARPTFVTVAEPKSKGKLFSFPSLLQPMFAVPAMAAMLLIIGFQNIVTFPHLEQQVAQVAQPRILPSITLVDGQSRGAEIRTVVAKAHESFLLSVDVPGDNRYSGYLCSLYSPSGKMVWQLQIPPSQVADSVPIQVPADTTDAGQNTLLIQGVTSDPQKSAPVDIVRYRFLLQIH
ncbi:zf-HC2 domain-containing protein [Alloacidobacterium dinghuense]|uniref:Zf-HC2 domain-containing protein n=1 Tax=Alloacidobacterium dinghuense TaxID=2763107 RepID=A0A7G8BK85_9BACT|nr:zf-HC2 domain-containing protein [Alloacidobacterium dinghuense]QNI32955.1 zf-HC2 domain-containing protein [Alloacidobacterium dinghuense]